MTDSRPTTSLVASTSDRLDADTTETRDGRALAAAMVNDAVAELRHEIEQSNASERARSRARSALRSVVARFDDAPHAADLIIGELAPTAREITLARANVEAMASLAEARAHGVAMMLEAGVSTMRGRIGVTLGARLVAMGEASIQTDPKTAAYVVGAGLAAIDRAVEADRTTRAEQRDEAARRDWERRGAAAFVVASTSYVMRLANDESIEVDTTELDAPDPVEHAQHTIAALQARKVEAGIAFLNAADDVVTIKPNRPHPDAVKKLAKLAIVTKGTSPPASPSRKLTPAELAARGIYSDSVYVEHPAARIEREKQERERAQRDTTINRITGAVTYRPPQPRPLEPAPHEQLRALRARNDDEPNDGGTP